MIETKSQYQDGGLDALVRRLRERGHRLTGPRLRVARAILSLRGHLSAEEITERLRGAGEAVSRATVYRTLALLQECGFTDAHDFGRGRKVYERAAGRPHHDHLFCIGCGEVIEFQERRIEALQDRVTRKHGFHPLYHSHKIFGYCRRCRRGRKLP